MVSAVEDRLTHPLEDDGLEESDQFYDVKQSPKVGPSEIVEVYVVLLREKIKTGSTCPVSSFSRKVQGYLTVLDLKDKP